MGETALNILLGFISVVLLLIIVGIILFVIQYRKKKLQQENEKRMTEESHRIDLLNTRLMSQEQTMQFIGQEIHDSVAQKLTLASIYTQKLEYENEIPAITGKLENINAMINDSLIELRDLSKTLTDNKQHESNLESLLQSECKKVNETGIWRAELDFSFGGSISVTVKSFLLRITQEFIQNSLKHAEGKLILIVVQDSNGSMAITISDDGKGFELQRTGSKGIGLTNMERRAHLIGGIFKLQSAPGKGTTLQITIPGGDPEPQ